MQTQQAPKSSGKSIEKAKASQLGNVITQKMAGD